MALALEEFMSGTIRVDAIAVAGEAPEDRSLVLGVQARRASGWRPEAALERVRAKLAELERQDPSAEMQFSMPDQWSRHLFIALCRRYGLKPYRYHRQRRTTVMVRAPRRFIEQVLWREFCDLDADLQAYLGGLRRHE